MLPDIVKAFNRHIKIDAITIESKLRLDVEKVKKNKSEEALQKHLELMGKTQKNVTIERKANDFLTEHDRLQHVKSYSTCLMNVKNLLVKATPLIKEMQCASCFVQDVCCTTQEEDEETYDDDHDKTQFGIEGIENYYDELLSEESFYSEDHSDY